MVIGCFLWFVWFLFWVASFHFRDMWEFLFGFAIGVYFWRCRLSLVYEIYWFELCVRGQLWWIWVNNNLNNNNNDNNYGDKFGRCWTYPRTRPVSPGLQKNVRNMKNAKLQTNSNLRKSQFSYNQKSWILILRRVEMWLNIHQVLLPHKEEIKLHHNMLSSTITITIPGVVASWGGGWAPS